MLGCVRAPRNCLPRPTGAYSVGFLDYEWFYKDGADSGSYKDEKAGAAADGGVVHLLVRLYYPSLKVGGGPIHPLDLSGASPPGTPKRAASQSGSATTVATMTTETGSREGAAGGGHSCIPHCARRTKTSPQEEAAEWAGRSNWIPSSRYYAAYGYTLKLPVLVSVPLFKVLTGKVKLWAVEHAPIAAPEGGGDAAAGESDLPLIVFSHGLCGMRTTYSSICVELASQGYIVAALEHRDGSAAMSYLQSEERVLQYTHPKDGRFGSLEFRNSQLSHRVEEIMATLDMLVGSASNGAAPENTWRHKSSKTSSRRRKDIVANPFSVLRSRIDKRRIGMVGHSFGAATTIKAVQMDERIKFAILLDPWMYTIEESFFERCQARSVPLLVVNSETFHWQENMDKIHLLLKRNHALAPDALTMQVTIRGTGHADHSDVTTIMPPMVRKKYGDHIAKDPKEALSTLTRLLASFVGTLGWRAPMEEVAAPSGGSLLSHGDLEKRRLFAALIEAVRSSDVVTEHKI